MRRVFLQISFNVLIPFLLLPTAHAAPLVGAPTRVTVAVTPMEKGSTSLSAQVKTLTGSSVTSGTVDYLLPNGQSLGSAIVQTDGTATMAITKLPAGTATNVGGDSVMPITAVYSTVDDALAGSMAPPILVPAAAIGAATPDFTVTGNPTTVTASPGAYGASLLTVTSVGGYTGSIQLSCSNLPAQVTCAFNPTQQSLAPNGSFVTTLQLQTQGPSGTASSSLLPLHPGFTLALALPGAFLLFGLARRRRFRGSVGSTFQLFAVALLVTGGSFGLAGCSQRYGYLHHPPPVAGGTPAGTYTVNVAVDGNRGSSVIEHTLPISLVVR